MNRRQALGAAVLTSVLVRHQAAAQGQRDIVELLRRGGCALMLRHTQTEPGIGDPPGYRLDQCATQRNLSGEGRAQAKRIGLWFKSNYLSAQSVQSSAWCRCKDTAELAFGRFAALGALNSSFDNPSSQDRQTQALRSRLKTIVAGQFEVWVSHQVNITAMTGEAVAMGEGLLVSGKGAFLGRFISANQGASVR